MRHLLLLALCSAGLCSPAALVYAQDGQITPFSVAQTYANAVFSYKIDLGTDALGEPKWSKGTAFLISNDPPLLATVAHLMHHVTDVSKLTVRDNITGTVRPVKAVFLHPEFKVDQGGKSAFSADVALIALVDPLPDSFHKLLLCEEEDTTQLQGQAIVSLGFPDYAAAEEEAGGSAEAVLREGIVQRTIDFEGASTQSPLHDRPLLEISTPCIDGESGCPIVLLTTGKVVGIQIGARKYNYSGTKIPARIIPFAIHTKYLLQLMVKEGLVAPPATP